MSEYIREIFEGGDLPEHFNQVIALHERPEMSWETVTEKVPSFPRGWYELCRLPSRDRIDFTCEYWLSKLPLLAPTEGHVEERMTTFFESLEEIGIFVTQERATDPFEVHMVYELKEASGFYHGRPPISSSAFERLKNQFAHVDLPEDYLAFLQIHDGFSKYTDTGVIRSKELPRVYQHLKELLGAEIFVRPDGVLIEPTSMIPFYESFGLHSYQCFYIDWHPHRGMGNVYFSEHDRTMSNFLNEERLTENLAFSSFVSWLVFYLEDIWHL